MTKLKTTLLSVIMTQLVPFEPLQPFQPNKPIFPIPGGGEILPIIEVVNRCNIDCFQAEYLNNSGKLSKFTMRFNQFNFDEQFYKVYLVNEYYPDGYLIYEEYFYGSISKIFTYDNSKNGLNNSIKLIFSDFDGSTNEQVYPIPFSKSSNTVLTQETSTYKPGTGKIVFSGGNWSNIEDNYILENFTSQYIPTFYHNLSLNDLSIKKANDHVQTFEPGVVNLYLTNRNGVFDDMPNNGKYLIVPLEVINVGSSCTLKIKNNYYVNPNTLLMSETYKSNYVETNRIYFPHNEMNYQGEYEGRIVFSSINSGSSNLTYRFTLNAQLNLLGDCIESEYCVKTKDGQDNNMGYEI